MASRVHIGTSTDDGMAVLQTKGIFFFKGRGIWCAGGKFVTQNTPMHTGTHILY